MTGIWRKGLQLNRLDERLAQQSGRKESKSIL